jgi:two-component system KDP operon response regulator KdpE
VGERVLVVDDDYLVLEHLRASLEAASYHVFPVGDGLAALEEFQRVQPHLVLLDLVMAGMSGWEVCIHLRRTSTVPIIMLTGLGTKEDIIRGLNLGADDYIVKPFQREELLARVQAVLRRARMPATRPDTPMRFGGGQLVVDPTNRRVIAHGKEANLTPLEYHLLLFFARNAGRVLPANTIFDNVWAYDTETSRESVKWYVWRLRKRIEKDPHEPRIILTERGIGYRFVLF